MLKRAQCQVAREHQQTMASVVLGCRGCHQTRECGSGCQEAPTGWQMWCRAVRNAAAPGKSSSPSPAVGLQRRAAGTIGKVRSQSQPSPALPWRSPIPAQPSPGSLLQPCPLCAPHLGPLFVGGGPRSHQACLTAGAPSRRSLRQHPHGCQSSGDNELLMCLKSDAGCMARS